MEFVNNKCVVSLSIVNSTLSKMRSDWVMVVMDQKTTREDQVTKFMEHNFINKVEKTTQEGEMKINKEIQFTAWLFNKLNDALQLIGFFMEPKVKILHFIPWLLLCP